MSTWGSIFKGLAVELVKAAAEQGQGGAATPGHNTRRSNLANTVARATAAPRPPAAIAPCKCDT